MIDWRVNAIHSLCPNSVWRNTENNELIWDDSNSSKKPTEAEIDAEVIKLQAEYASQEYARKREEAYPSIQECVHAILDDELDALQAKRAEVKTKFPKE